MQPSDESGTDQEAMPDLAPVVITAGLGVDGEHGPLFSGVDLSLAPGFHAVQMPGGPSQSALLLTLAGRLKASHGTVAVCGDTTPRAIRRHCAIAAFPDIDELEGPVTVDTVLTEQRRWLAPWYTRCPGWGGIPPNSTRYSATYPCLPDVPTSSSCPILNCF